MKRLFIGFFVFANTYLMLFCSPPKFEKELTNKETLIKEIEYLINDPALANAQIGLYIESLANNEVFYRRNERKLFVPASNQKLYTTAAALEKLDSTFQFKTEFYFSGSMHDSVLDGDLIVRGMGDPSISGRFRDDDVLAYFEDWADSLVTKGVKRITGDVVGNDSYFSDDKLGFGWNWDDETYWYSAQIGALSFNDNCVDFKIKPGNQPGDSIYFTTNPKSDYFEIDNRAVTVSSDSNSTLQIWRERGRNSIVFEGGLPVNSSSFTTSITIEEPSGWFMDTFASVLEAKGVFIDGDVVIETNNFNPFFPDSLKRIFIHSSKNLSQMVKVVNKGSHNLYAEQIFKTLGAEVNKNGTAKEGSKVISDWLSSIGVPDNLAIPVDGSGLSRMNLVSPFSTATLLRHMYYSKNFDPFYNSLPIAGVDGTIRSRMKNSIAQGVVRAKTGYVRYVRSLSGYTTDRDGNDYIFVIMVNHYSVPTSFVNNLQDKICILLTGYREGS